VLTAVVISDLHVGSAFAPMPKGFRLSTGARVRPNKGQLYLNRCWKNFTATIPDTFDLLILNGDLIHGQNHKEMAADLSEVDPEWQQRAALEFLHPLSERANRVYATKGSGYHVGEVGRWEEQLAHSLGAEPDERGHYAQDWLLLNVEGVLLDVAHTQSVVMRYVSMPLEREGQFDDMIADSKVGGASHLIIRSHAHRWVSTDVELKRSVGTASWQLQGPYVKRGKVPNRMFSKYIGGLWVELHPERVGKPEHCMTLHPVLYKHPKLRRAKYVRAS